MSQLIVIKFTRYDKKLNFKDVLGITR